MLDGMKPNRRRPVQMLAAAVLELDDQVFIRPRRMALEQIHRARP
ncbi:MAG: hypothetical protein JWN24_781, partial [Phycisphaerales bacterium]|nr:hypothetical protein [Phycisphaerales bacterium]